MNKNQIFIECGTNYKAMTKDILTKSELAALIGERSTRIGIKPNMVSASDPSNGATTHREVLEGIVEYLRENGFKNIMILEGSWVGDKTMEVFEAVGYGAICEKYQVEFHDTQKDRGVKTDCAGMELNICESVSDIEFLINVPVLKGHCQTKITCALKNMKGLIPNSEKRRFHSMGLHKPIAHLNTAIHQDFIVVDNICGDLDFEDGGHPVVMNRILTGRDPVLMDSYVCHMMHYETGDVPYVKLAAELGVGCDDISKANIIACSEGSDIELPKSRKVVELSFAVDDIDSCSACYGYLIPALDKLKEEGLLCELKEKIHIGQGYRSQTGELGVGHCTRKFRCHLEGCPPLENDIYQFLKEYIQNSK